MSLQFEKLRTSDEIQQLYRIVYPDKDCSKFDWLYNQNPRGQADMFAFRDSSTNNVVGVYVIIPMLLNLQGREVLIGQASDAMVHPDYRRKHIFTKLVTESLRYICNKYEYLIAFPHNISRGGFLRADWVELGDWSTWSLPLQPEAIAHPLTKIPILGGVVSTLVKLFIDIYINRRSSQYHLPDTRLVPLCSKEIEVDDIVSRLTEHNPVMLVRDSEFVRWRFQSIPRNNYHTFLFLRGDKQLGYIVYKSHGSSVMIVDFIVSPEPEIICAATSMLIDHCRQQGFASIHCQLSKHAYCCDSLKTCGFVQRSTRYAIMVLPTKSNRESINYSDCYISQADTDWL